MIVLDDRKANTPPYYGPGAPPDDIQLAKLLGSGFYSAAEIVEKFDISEQRIKNIKNIAKTQANAGGLEDLQK